VICIHKVLEEENDDEYENEVCDLRLRIFCVPMQKMVCCLMSGEPHTNRLIHERSPYLLQPAYNPVDWYPWGDKAFAKARSENKLIFLSIGYSTCHWCHVMEHESFEN